MYLLQVELNFVDWHSSIWEKELHIVEIYFVVMIHKAHCKVQIEHTARSKYRDENCIVSCLRLKLFGTRTHICMSHGQLAYWVVEETMLL